MTIFTPEGLAQLAAIAGLLVITVGIYAKLLSNTEKRLEKRVDNLDNKVDKLEDRLGERIANVETRIANVETRVDGIYQTLAIKSNSPLSLTKRGEEIIDLIDGKALIIKHKDIFFAELQKGVTDESMFTVQAVARDTIKSHIKDYLTESDKEILSKNGVDLLLLSSALSILLRDMYLGYQKISE